MSNSRLSGGGESGPKRMRRLLMLVAAMSALPPPVQAATPTLLEATGPWSVDYADESCALRRTFGDADHPTRLELRQYEPGGLTSVTIVSPLNARGTDFRYAFAPDKTLRDMGPPDRARTKEGDSVIRFTTPSVRTVAETEEFFQRKFHPDGKDGLERLPTWPVAERAARLAAIEGLTLDNAFADDIQLQTGPMSAAMAGMDKCFDDLLTDWGLDPAVQATLSRRVTMKKPSEGGDLFKLQEAVMREARSWDMRMRMMIDAEGQMTACHIVGRTETSAPAERYCQAFREAAQFEPALDKDGHPVPSYFLEETSVLTVVVQG